jgi:AcrR family transcriptional regulator
LPDLAAHSPPKAARILAAAGELLLARGSKGVTIAEVARKAHIGKGTVYLYWKTKEDLLLDLVCRDFVALADEVTAAVTADSDLARPSRLCPHMLHIAAAHPFVSALQRNDDGLLGVLTDDPRSARLLDALGPEAVMHQALPIWRANDLARADWPLADQAFALHSLLTGFRTTTGLRYWPQIDDPGQVLAAAVTALLGPERATPEQVRAAAAEGIRIFAEQRATALDLIAQPTHAS